MQRVPKKIRSTQLPTEYDALVKFQMLRPIHDEVDYDNAQEMIDRLTCISHRSAGQSAYLEALTILFAAYEAEHHAKHSPRKPLTGQVVIINIGCWPNWPPFQASQGR